MNYFNQYLKIRFLTFLGFFLTYIFSCDLVFGQEGKVSLTPYVGFQKNDFNWSIAGTIYGTSPNIYSELQWKSIKTEVLGLNVDLPVKTNFSLEIDINHGSVYSGSVTDRDYGADNRTNTIFDATLISKTGSSDHLSVGIDYSLLKLSKIGLQVTLGYGVDKQTLYLQDNADLNSSYKTNWTGPYVKLSTRFNLTRVLVNFLSLQYSQISYTASADWNLIPSFQHPKSFDQHAYGYGILPAYQINLQYNKTFSPGLRIMYNKWNTGAGTDQLYLSSGDVETTRFNSAQRNLWSFDILVKISL